MGAGNKETGVLSKIRQRVHIMFALILIGVIMLFSTINNPSVVDKIFTVAGYTYGPLLGLYMFGFFTKRRVTDKFVPYVAIASPILTFILNILAKRYLGGYHVAYEFLVINGLITFIGLWIFSRRSNKE